MDYVFRPFKYEMSNLDEGPQKQSASKKKKLFTLNSITEIKKCRADKLNLCHNTFEEQEKKSAVYCQTDISGYYANKPCLLNSGINKKKSNISVIILLIQSLCKYTQRTVTSINSNLRV